MLLEDFNLIEEDMDRNPPHRDNGRAVKEFFAMRAKFRLIDGWRGTYPDKCSYTFEQENSCGDGTSKSRINRIYVFGRINETASDWEILKTPISSDHKLVSVKVVDRNIPHIGPGRWVIPLFIMKDRDLNKEI